ncbi:Ltp family lipoprotein [Anaerovorax odorimutans]|uniref:Ltp family lipoprotein n=1 Tax=Anaerovorax odorimutans TaxID=109327 RepID=A0ABT1RPL3_9FIRM|nr:Ltp family lipoprotein [Anaerovorax odorimutans]MCQ4637132.1 Ltp family lipoprotein [Anaerovorax odorimutans]
MRAGDRKNAKTCPSCGAKNRKSLYKRWWFIVIVIIVVLGVIGSALGGNSESGQSANETQNATQAETQAKETTETKPAVPAEYKSALNKAKLYSDTMYMSKAGLYDQLTSEYGEQFSAEAAQYAIDNLEADYKKNALEKAKLYQNEMSMSPEAIRDQLTSDYGEKFTEKEADYAIKHLNVNRKSVFMDKSCGLEGSVLNCFPLNGQISKNEPLRPLQGYPYSS